MTNFSKTRTGFTYDVMSRLKKDGTLIDQLQGVRNRIPMEGLNDLASAYFKGTAPPGQLYVGLWSGSLVPTGEETAANLLDAVTEVTSYSDSTRIPLVLGSVDRGTCSNLGQLARFDVSANATVNGAFLSTVNAKGARYGKLLSVARFPAPRVVDDSMYLEVLCGFQFISI